MDGMLIKMYVVACCVLDQLVSVVSGLCCGSHGWSHAHCTGDLGRHRHASDVMRPSAFCEEIRWQKLISRSPASAVTSYGRFATKIWTTVDSIFDHSRGRGLWLCQTDNSVETEQWKSRQDCLLISQRIDQIHDSKTTDHCTFASRACVQIINQSHSSTWAITGIVQGMFLHINTHSKVSPPCLTTGQDTAIGPTPSLPAGILLRTTNCDSGQSPALSSLSLVQS